MRLVANLDPGVSGTGWAYRRVIRRCNSAEQCLSRCSGEQTLRNAPDPTGVCRGQLRIFMMEFVSSGHVRETTDQEGLTSEHNVLVTGGNQWGLHTEQAITSQPGV